MKIAMTTLAAFFLLSLLSTLSAQNRMAKQPAEAGIAVSDSGVQRLTLYLNELEAQLNAEVPRKGMTVQTSNLNLSKSNINKTKGKVKSVAVTLGKLKGSEPAKYGAALAELKKMLADLESPVQDLYNSLLSLGGDYAAKAAELKTRHDTVKNSIGNIR